METRARCLKYGRCAVEGKQKEIDFLEDQIIKVEILATQTKDPDKLEVYNSRIGEHTNQIAYKQGEIFNIACSVCPLV